MYPAFTTTRPRLPSVLSVYQPIEQYQADLGKRKLLLGEAVAALEPLDAYLAHLLLNIHPGEPAIVDLAAEVTAGASTLVGLLHPRRPMVRAVGGPLPGDRRSYRGAVEAFLQRQDLDVSQLQWLSSAELSTELHGETDLVVFVSASRRAVDAEIEQWLNIAPSAIVLVFGLGAVGDCPVLDALVGRFPAGSPRRLALLRDGGEVLSASRLGVVASRDNAALELALRRLKQIFTGNYNYLGLLRSVTEQAIHAKANDPSSRDSSVHFLTWNNEINQLKKTAFEAASDAEELRALKGSLSYRLSMRFRRWRRQFAPEQTRRYRLFQLLRRAARVWRRDGTRVLFSRSLRRCLGR